MTSTRSRERPPMGVALVENGLGHEPLFRGWLEQAGHQVSSFPDAKVFLTRAAEQDFDAIVMDWQTPDEGALEVLFQLRWVLASASAVIFLYLDSDEGGRVRLLQAGADDCVPKPIGKLELVARLEALQRRAKAAYRDGPTLAEGREVSSTSADGSEISTQAGWIDPHRQALEAARRLR